VIFYKYIFRIVVIVMAFLLHTDGFAQDRITLEDGSVLNFFIVKVVTTEADPKPLVILMGGGPGNVSISRDTSRWLGSEFASRGWFVAVPVSPNNSAFRGAENNQKITYLIDELRKRDDVSSGKVLLVGISNGGISALEIARRTPKDFLGVVAVPALSTSAFDNGPLRDFPIYLRIGGNDELGWAERFDEVVESLREAGVVLDAAIIDSAPHMFRMHWPSLDAWLQRHANL
jgi:dienelactone hydrolase